MADETVWTVNCPMCDDLGPESRWEFDGGLSKSVEPLEVRATTHNDRYHDGEDVATVEEADRP